VQTRCFSFTVQLFIFSQQAPSVPSVASTDLGCVDHVIHEWNTRRPQAKESESCAEKVLALVLENKSLQEQISKLRHQLSLDKEPEKNLK
jgi:hypothetical protein